MIIQGLMELVMMLLQNVLSFIDIPDFPSALTDAIDSVLSLIFDNLGIVGLFVRWQTIVVSIPLVIIIINMDKLYKLVMWILKKIPMLGMQ